MNIIRTTHDLDFEVANWEIPEWAKGLLHSGQIKNDDEYPGIKWKLFRVGTCEGQWRQTPEAYEILSVINGNPGNGHFNDVLEWFAYACRCSNLPLRIRKFTNDEFKKHLIEKRGFVGHGEDVEKWFIVKEEVQVGFKFGKEILNDR
jgi:hypothetical protein